MAKKKVFKKFTGRAAWAMIYSPDEGFGKEFWKISLYPDIDTIMAIKDAGIQLKAKDDDGEKSGVQGKFFTFRRDTTSKFGGSEVQPVSPPWVYDKKGKKLVSYTQDEDGDYQREGEPVLIGNGSEVEVTVEVYNTKSFGKQCRLYSVKILDLIEYNPDEEEDEEEVEEQEVEVVVKKKVNKKVPF